MTPVCGTCGKTTGCGCYFGSDDMVHSVAPKRRAADLNIWADSELANLSPAGRIQFVMELLNPMVYDEATDSYVPGTPLITREQAIALLEDAVLARLRAAAERDRELLRKWSIEKGK